MKLKEVYFEKIKSGEKMFEIRLNDDKRRLIKVGDVIEFKKEPSLEESLDKVVKNLHYFKSFDELMEELNVEDIGFAGVSKVDVLDAYYSFYSKEDEKRFGVVAMEV